jgi:hypothetical protein
MEIVSPQEARLHTTSIVQGKELLSQDMCKLLLEPTLVQACQLGQYVNLRSADGEERSFAIVNQPSDDYYLEVRVQRLAGDLFSDWVFDQLDAGAELEIQGPFDKEELLASRQPASAAATVALHAESRPKDPPPDMELWAALQEGKLLLQILQDFYGRVYKDDLLSPYFHGITMQHSIESVFISAANFTDRNVISAIVPDTHHWMVISDETFQYHGPHDRCHRRAGLSKK